MNRTVTVLSTHHQIMIWDVEDRTSVAQWFTGNEMVVFGPKGVNVDVAYYQNIEITLRRAEEPAGILDKALKKEGIETALQCIASGVLTFGHQGFRVGSPTDDGELIEWETGMTLVEVWVERLHNGTKVLFLLKPLHKGYEW